MKEQNVIDTINKMISLCEPVSYKNFNLFLRAKNKEALRQAEEENDKIGLANYDLDNEGISTLSIIATITDILTDKRLAFKIDDDGMITGVQWYKEK